MRRPPSSSLSSAPSVSSPRGSVTPEGKGKGKETGDSKNGRANQKARTHARSLSAEMSQDAPPLPTPPPHTRLRQLSNAFQANGPAPVVPPRPPPRRATISSGVLAATIGKQLHHGSGGSVTVRPSGAHKWAGKGPPPRHRTAPKRISNEKPWKLPSATSNSSMMEDWTPEDVWRWVTKQYPIGKRVATKFLSSGWDGDMLSHAQEDELMHDLGIEKGDCVELLRRIARISSSET